MNLFNALDFKQNEAVGIVIETSSNPSTAGISPGRLIFNTATQRLGYWDNTKAGANKWNYLSDTPTTVVSLPALDDTGDVDNPTTANKLEIGAGKVKNSHFSTAGADALALTKVGQGLTAKKLIISLASGGSASGLIEATNFQIDGSGNLEAIGSMTFKAGRDPMAAMEVVTKQYADTIAQGYRDQKESCRYATRNNIASLAAVDLDYNSGTPVFDTVGVGSVSVTNGSATVTGTNTKFKQSFEATDKILLADAGGTYYEYTVSVVTSNTSLTLTATYAQTTGAGRNYQTKPAAGDRVLIKDQTTLSQNGIYTLGTPDGYNVVALTRATDADGTNPTTGKSDLSGNCYTFVEEGSMYADTMWTIVSAGEIVIGTDDIEWTQTAGQNTFAAGAGLTLTGNVIDIGTASSSRIVVNADNIDLATVSVTDITSSAISASDTVRGRFDSYGRLTHGSSSFLGNGATGMLVQTGASAYAGRTLTAGSASIVITNGNGVSGNPTINTVQGINTSDAPQFRGLAVSGSSVSGGVTDVFISGGAHTNVTGPALPTLRVTHSQLTWLAGSGANHYMVELVSPASTHTSSSTRTIPIAATLYVSAAPTQAGLVTITNSYAIYAPSGNVRFGGQIIAGSTPTTVTDSAGKVLSAALNTVGTAQGGTGLTSFTTNSVLFASSSSAIGQVTPGTGFLKQSGGAPSWASIAWADISSAFPQATYLTVSTDASLTNERALTFNGTNFSVTDAGAGSTYTVNTIQNIDTTASPTFRGTTLSPAATAGGVNTLVLNAASHTAVTATKQAFKSAGGTWTITGGFGTQYFNTFEAYTITAASALTITNAATVYIAGAPSTINSAVITNKYALAIGAGVSLMGDGMITFNQTAGTPAAGLRLLRGDAQEESVVDSDWIEWEAPYTLTGPEVHNSYWKAQVIAGMANSTFVLASRIDSGSWANKLQLDNDGQLTTSDYRLNLTYGAYMGTVSANGILASRVWYFPDATGVVALTTNSTFGSGSTWNGNVIGVTYGGTGAATFTSKGVLYGNGTSAVQVSNVNATATAMYLKQTSSGNPTFTQIVVADVSGGAASATTITIAGTANQLTSSAGAQDLSTNRTWTLSLPSAIYAPGTISTSALAIWTGSAGAGTSVIDTNRNIVNITSITTSANGFIGSGVTATSPFHALRSSATTNASIGMLLLNAQSTGTAANWFGGKIELLAETSTGTSQNLGTIEYVWKNATDASRVGSLAFSVHDSTGPYAMLTLDADDIITLGATTVRCDGDGGGNLGTSSVRWNTAYCYTLNAISAAVIGGGGSAGRVNIGANSTGNAAINFNLTSSSLTTTRTAGNLEAVTAGLYYTPNVTGGISLDRKKVALICSILLGYNQPGVVGGGFASDGASATSVTVTHNLGTRDVAVYLRRIASPYDIVYWADFFAATADTVTINVGSNTPLADDAWQAIIIG